MPVSVLDATWTIDISKPCKEGKDSIETCGMRKEGGMFPYCAIGDIGENRCPQVVVRFITRSATEVMAEQIAKSDA